MSDYLEITFHANENWVFKSEKYSLSSENVANKFKVFRQDGTLCDVDLVSGDTVVKAHRVVLAAACVYFETMFKSGLEECNRKSVPLPSIPPDVLPLVVEFIYSGQTVISSSTVPHLVDAANMLQLQELSVGCAQYLRKQLHPSNVVGIIRLAETHNLVQLAEEGLSYAIKHWEAVADGEEFVHLSVTMLMKLLTSDELVIDSEVQETHPLKSRFASNASTVNKALNTLAGELFAETNSETRPGSQLSSENGKSLHFLCHQSLQGRGKKERGKSRTCCKPVTIAATSPNGLLEGAATGDFSISG
ncbi:Kelch-like protein 3 [Eumeta japonica]|uniref:Kelch-like protein 3 n=1 Tax=Eumeta variegata TaxID=151549 RepID=A0A4C1VF84_EUMVA|nr:Kelch-like protein 3 [Eumeta japonica]